MFDLYYVFQSSSLSLSLPVSLDPSPSSPLFLCISPHYHFNTKHCNLVLLKVCNHPELFERREPRSPLVFTIPPLRNLIYSSSDHARFQVVYAF